MCCGYFAIYLSIYFFYMYIKLYIIESGILSNYVVKLWQFYYRKQKVMLEDVAWKQERYDDVILMN